MRLWERLGSHPRTVDGVAGTSFAVLAPNAAAVSVIGDFNGWKPGAHPLEAIGGSGIWEALRPRRRARRRVQVPDRVAAERGTRVDKADPYAVRQETPPRTGSVVWDLDYRWRDAEWMAGRARAQAASAPISIYEVHLGSWRRVPEEGNRPLTYREAARSLAEHVARARLHARRAAARHGAPVLRLVGLPGHRLLRADRRGSARPRTSCTSSTRCTRRASA